MLGQAEQSWSMIKVEKKDPHLLQGTFHLLVVLPALRGVRRFGAPILFLARNYFYLFSAGLTFRPEEEAGYFGLGT